MLFRSKFGLEFTYVDTSQPQLVEPAIRPNTKYLFIETPTNPMLQITDIQCVSNIAHKKNVKVVVDNTFASPYIQRPLTMGADIVLHSTTKFLNGHSDSVGGVLILKHQDDVEWFKFVQNAAGAILGPMDSWLILRGRARCCGRPFSFRYAFVELLTAALFTTCWLRFPPAVAFAGWVLLGCLIAATFIDLDHFIIPDVFTIGLGVTGLLLSMFIPALHGHGAAPAPLAHLRSAAESLQGLLIGSGLVLWIGQIGRAHV